MKLPSLVIATRNAHKTEEIREMLPDADLEVLDMTQFDHCPDVEEDGATLEENALKKARSAHACTGLPVIADDTGLEVPGLGGAPGVYSARYAGENATYDDNNRKLLVELTGVRGEQRNARFRCVVAFVDRGVEMLFEGSVEGRIMEHPRGTNGFGYDPVFLPEGFERSYAELTAEEKNGISHRARAIRKFIDFLRSRSMVSP